MVEVYTGSEPGSETEANVYLQLIGSRGDSGKRVLFNTISDLKVSGGNVISLSISVLYEYQLCENVFVN